MSRITEFKLRFVGLSSQIHVVWTCFLCTRLSQLWELVKEDSFVVLFETSTILFPKGDNSLPSTLEHPSFKWFIPLWFFFLLLHAVNWDPLTQTASDLSVGFSSPGSSLGHLP